MGVLGKQTAATAVEPACQHTDAKSHAGTLLPACMSACRCVIVRDGHVIGTGYNMTNHTRNVSACCCAVTGWPQVPSSAQARPLDSPRVCRPHGTPSWKPLTKS